MPRSKNKEIIDLFERIRDDEDLRYLFARLIIDIIGRDFSAPRDLADIVSEKLFDKLRMM